VPGASCSLVIVVMVVVVVVVVVVVEVVVVVMMVVVVVVGMMVVVVVVVGEVVVEVVVVVAAATATIMIITIGHIVKVRESLTKAPRKRRVRETEERVPQGSLHINNIKHCSRKIGETVRLPRAPTSVILLGISMDPVYLDKKREPYS
jgi:hypothetical protein